LKLNPAEKVGLWAGKQDGGMGVTGCAGWGDWEVLEDEVMG
jgi:hypothetical protein